MRPFGVWRVLGRWSDLWLVVCGMVLLGCHTVREAETNEAIEKAIFREQIRTMKDEVDTHRLTYLLQEPAGERPEQGWPLLLFLHGYGECGIEIDKVRKHGPPKLVSQFDELRRCVIVSPQCPPDSWWRVKALRALVEEVVAERGDINRDRLYVSGLSMGGYGIWSFLSQDPDFFAAAMPICGGGDPFKLPANRPPEKVGVINEFDPDGLRRARNLPVWAFHGRDDTSVPVQETEILMDILREAGNRRVKLTVYDGVGHVGAWERAYDDAESWAWLFSQ